jgi:hypothetical protein
MDHEIALVNAFILPARRPRFTKFLSEPEHRPKVLKRLYHLRDLDPRFLVEIQPSDQNSKAIAALLTERGARGQCHLISTDDELDGRDLPLLEALDQIIGFGQGTLVSCIPGRLGYFEGEGPAHRFILDRTAT